MPSKHTKLEELSTCLIYQCRQVSWSCVGGGLHAVLTVVCLCAFLQAARHFRALRGISRTSWVSWKQL